MAAQGQEVVVSLRRPTSDKSWGFVLQGGVDQGLPIFVHKITRNGIAHKSGLEPGDVILKICEMAVGGFLHNQVKAEILRAGNDLDFTVKKRDFNISAYNQSMNNPAAAAPPNAGRVEVIEEHNWRHGGPTFKNVQPKSYKILEQQLPQAAGGGAAPSSYKEMAVDQSPYLRANGPSIQKAYGES